MQSNYVIWARDIVRGACSLSPITGWTDSWKLLKGIPLKEEFPSSAQFKMDPDDPTDSQLTDSLYNANKLIVASERLRSFLAVLDFPGIECLPVSVFNHKSRLIIEPYAIINLLESIDCLVVDACEPRWSRIDKTDIASLEHLVIDESRIDPARLLFRPKHYKRAILAHRTLAQKIDAAGYTGIRWVELTNYPGN
jgi:hypothetical protein